MTKYLPEANTIKSEVLKLHTAFALEEGERGKTDITEFMIDTGEAPPKKQPARRVPLTVREKVTEQIDDIESTGVIRPSNSAWASPIVLERKKDGGTTVCVDYRQL